MNTVLELIQTHSHIIPDTQHLAAVTFCSLLCSAIYEQMLAKGKITARQTTLEGLFDKNPAAGGVWDET